MIKKVHLMAMVLVVAVSCIVADRALGAQWAGVDETVIEKYAEEAGRSPRDSYINTDQGDLLLFVFLLAGSVGGFIGGYYFRILFHEKDNIAAANHT
jgi:cobalt/nickel transport system permease protein